MCWEAAWDFVSEDSMLQRLNGSPKETPNCIFLSSSLALSYMSGLRLVLGLTNYLRKALSAAEACHCC